MDVILFITAIILIFLICIVFVLNYVGKTSNIEKIYKILTNIDPTVVGFSLGLNKKTGKFVNVVTDADGKLEIRSDNQPIHTNGQFIINRPHGDITANSTNNGFDVSGFNENTFNCPDGYVGLECKMEDLCKPDEIGTYKALTYSQFNDLSAYNSISDKNNLKARGTVDEQTHPRIRIYCKDDLGNYELQACPDNQLLNKNLECINYDVCVDRIDGYKHNMAIIGGTKLLKDEYYICENQQSKLMKCENNTVFSAKNFGCIVESQCYNRGHTTLPLTDTSYIECEHDVGKIVNCEYGVYMDKTLNLLTCKEQKCVEKRFRTRTPNIAYDYGAILCDSENKPIVKMCSADPKDRKVEYTFNGNTFYYTLENWPKSVLTSLNACISPADYIIYNPIIKLNWANLLNDAYSFDINTMKFQCPSTTKYINDYNNGKIIGKPPDADLKIDFSSPCQNEQINTSNTHFHLHPVGVGEINIAYYEEMFISNLEQYKSLSFWPKKVDSHFLLSNITISSKNLTITTYQSRYPPYNFHDRLTDGYLEYIPFSLSPTNDLYFWFIEDGVLTRPRMFEPTVYDTIVISPNDFSGEFKTAFTRLLDPKNYKSKVQFDNNQQHYNGYPLCSPTASDINIINCGKLGEFSIEKNKSTLTISQ